jgi:hypothetical protein
MLLFSWCSRGGEGFWVTMGLDQSGFEAVDFVKCGVGWFIVGFHDGERFSFGGAIGS